MASRGRFHIPTASQMQSFDENKPKVKSLFRQKTDLQHRKADSGKTLGQFKRGTDHAEKTIHVLETTTTPPTATKKLLPPVTATVSSSADDSESKGLVLKDGPLQPLMKSTKSNCISVNPRQRGNPILKHIRNIPWEFGDITGDYEMGNAACALYLSIRYHQLNPNYIHDRLKKLGRSYDLRVMLVQIDVKDPHFALKELAKICILADCTLVLAFSPEEAGRYLETYKIYEHKPPDAIMEKTEKNFLAMFTDCLTTVKSVNKTDCMTVLTSFGSFEEISKVSSEDLSLCPGFGPQKAQRLYNVLHEPFIKEVKRKTECTSTSSSSTSASNSPQKKTKKATPSAKKTS